MKHILFSLLTLVAMLPAVAGDRQDYITLDSRLGHGGSQTWYMMRDGETKQTGRDISMPGFNPQGWAEAASDRHGQELRRGSVAWRFKGEYPF